MQCMQHPKTGVKQLFYIEKVCIQNCIHFDVLHTLKTYAVGIFGEKDLLSFQLPCPMRLVSGCSVSPVKRPYIGRELRRLVSLV